VRACPAKVSALNARAIRITVYTLGSAFRVEMSPDRSDGSLLLENRNR